MRLNGLLIPQLLLTALKDGRWPRTAAEGVRQNLRPLVPVERIRRLAPDESSIYLYAPPFQTVAEHLAGKGREFYARFGALDQLVPEAAVEIGDFGLGSDAPILLDYRTDAAAPRVIRLLWPGSGSPNRWVEMSPDFANFFTALGL
jgi:hypothetical protein